MAERSTIEEQVRKRVLEDEKLKVFKEHALSLRHDSRKNGIRFSDSKGWGRIRNGKKIYD